MEELYQDGKIRAIGVCNCLPHHLKVLLDNAKIAPSVNQIEYHIGLMQTEAEEFSKANGVVVEAWAPLVRGRVFGKQPLKGIAEKHGKTEAQVLIRWCLQHDIVPLPKSVTPARIIENANVFDFSLSDEEMAMLDNMQVEGKARIGSHPDTVAF
jgi:diketogulonate reductase-like aldo/keto reductase